MSKIEYFYSTHSAFAYIGSKKLLSIAHQENYQIVHKPINLDPVIQAAKGDHFKDFSEAYQAYFFGREIDRWSEFRQAKAIKRRPTYHDNDLSLSSGMIIAAVDAGLNADNLAHAILEAHWRDDADHADPVTLSRIAESAGYDADTLLNDARAPHIQAIFQANTEEAIARYLFGSPTYFVDGDMFYGQDHLELLEHTLQKL